MFDFFEKLAIAAVVGFLHKVIKNPSSVAKEGTIISDIATAATDADAAVNGVTWTKSGGTPTQLNLAAGK